MRHGILTLGLALLLGTVVCGCISYKYEGTCAEKPTAVEEIKVYTEANRIQSTYTELGNAQVSGNYQNVSRERMMDKLKSKASDCGADAILIVEQQVEPIVEDAPSGGAFRTAFDSDNSSNSWNQLQSDVDQNYGNIRRDAPATTTVYRRVIRAKFLKFDTKK